MISFSFSFSRSARVLALACVLVVVGCRSSAVRAPAAPPPPPPPVAPLAAPHVLPAICARDLSAWSPSRSAAMVPSEVMLRALRPAVLALQARVCACAATVAMPASLGVAMRADPARGQTEVTAALADPCMASFVATYPAFAFAGDDLRCTGAECHAPPATFVAHFELALSSAP